ncbi:ferredoxin [Amycolatopsis sp. K13G38]|uniref:Ferredoxin n=1 Tax=Amycolatopsis acididurans TaxID=2724524 RepID=A0ABX1JD34_9PSEU|nr:ferredoxin [Amycolatopsis acididurans]NKQ56182.1 ferredoxin [Amycolatopsis acididurans]
MTTPEQSTKVTVDQVACEGTAFCVRSLPDVFELNDDGVAEVNEAGARQAAFADLQDVENMCPTTAIRVANG